jgi:hypothetical protein
MTKTAIAAAAADGTGAGPSGRNKTRARRLRRAAAALAAVCALSGGAALALAGPASAAAGQFVTIINGVTGQCLQNVNGVVSTQPCDGSSNQVWYVSGGQTGDNPYSTFGFQSLASPVYQPPLLTSDSSYGYYGNLSIQPDDLGADQLWDDYPSGSALGDQLENAQTGLCLESDQYGNAYAQQCNVNHWQYWQMNQVPFPFGPN